MPEIVYPDVVTGAPVHLHVEVRGSGAPILLIAPGGMKSSIPLWANAPYDPFRQWADAGFQVVAMDQRNAGRSRGPVHPDHGWLTYAQDQLAVLDHLGIDRFIVAGMCIGGAYAMQLLHLAPARAVGCVLFQTIGLDNNRAAFHQMYDAWADGLSGERTDVSPAAWAGLRSNLYDGDRLLFSVDESSLPAIQAPVLVLQGNDLYHPASVSRRVAAGLPEGQLIEHWKTGADIEPARLQTLAFLRQTAGQMQVRDSR